jgi:putative flavoprotein involved in K+ transport
VERVDVAIVGAGQAGLAASHELTTAGVEHVLLERGAIGQSWRGRWDSFCLVTPNWTVQLPDQPYDGDDPDGYLPRDEIVAYLERYAGGFDAPVRVGVEVEAVASNGNDAFAMRTSDGELRARVVVLATGAYQRPHRPKGTETLPPDLRVIDVEGYTNPQDLPDGRVLIVGSGQSGCQLAEELTEAGREVVLSCGRAPWNPRRIGERDMVWWAVETGFLDQPVETLPDRRARLLGNVLGSGHGGGHDLHLRTLQAGGVTLAGRFQGASGQEAAFADDLAACVAWGDERYGMTRDLIRTTAIRKGWDLPEMTDPEPFDASAAPQHVDLRGFGAAIVASGFRPEYGPLAPWPGVFDEMGFPIHRDGQSTVTPGVFFLGVHFLRKRKSSLLLGVGEDAAIVARGIAERLGAA